MKDQIRSFCLEPFGWNLPPPLGGKPVALSSLGSPASYTPAASFAGLVLTGFLVGSDFSASVSPPVELGLRHPLAGRSK